MTGHRLRAPSENLAILAQPPLKEVGELLGHNRKLLRSPLVLLGQSLPDLRSWSRQSVLTSAQDYLREEWRAESGEWGAASGEWGEQTSSQKMGLSENSTTSTSLSPHSPLSTPHSPPSTLDSRLSTFLVAGHQPELFHPGVWAKNFALYGLARQHGAIPINLVVDNDTAKSCVLHVPADDHLAAIPYDHWQGNLPYEERPVQDEKLFAGLVDRVRPLVHSWPYVPLLEKFWPDVLRFKQRTPLLGERFARARRRWERNWGCHNLEVPLSRLCQTESFAWFACHLLDELPRFHATYNEAVRSYRRLYGIRSSLHPVPDLGKDGDWLETPFWIWKKGQNPRNRLFAQISPGCINLRAGQDISISLPRPRAFPRKAAADWVGLEGQGIKVRTRALTTTLFSRLFFADLFIHGIGGGKYDELTDRILHNFYGLEPPGFMVLSATLLLPLPRFPIDSVNLKHLARRQRDLWWNPQRHLPHNSGPWLNLLAEKLAWINRPGTSHADRKERFLQLRRLNELLRQFQDEEYHQTAQAVQRTHHELAVNQVLGRRDYSFCLYPEEELREFLTGSFL